MANIWRRLASGNERPGLPDSCRGLDPDLERAVDLLNATYRPVLPDEVDVTVGWRDEAARLDFLMIADQIEQTLKRKLGNQWSVTVSRSPGVTEIGLMGEYMSDWPLWTRDGLSGPEDWPMLSDSLKHSLRQWAAAAEPDHERGPAPQATDQLLRELRAELGHRFSVSGP